MKELEEAPMRAMEERVRDAFGAAAQTVTSQDLPGLPTPPGRSWPGRFLRAKAVRPRIHLLAPAAAAAGVAIIVAATLVVAPRLLTGTHAAGGGPAAPRQFNPLTPNVSFGWLPPGQSLMSGGALPTEVHLEAGPPRLLPEWQLNAYAKGQCRLIGPGGSLKCTATPRTGTTLRFSERAPAVDGHRAFWTGNVSGGTDLAWQYARGGWAALHTPDSKHATQRRHTVIKAEAIKIAAHVRFGPALPLLFPARLTGLSSQWRISEIFFVHDAGVLQAESYTLTTAASRFHPHVGDEGAWANAPYIEIRPAPRYGTCTPHDPASRNTSEIINGYRVVVKRMTVGGLPHQELCAAHADGFWLSVIEFGSHPAIGAATFFKQHIRLLGTNTANWTKNPLG
jgi:hypothetical protein